MKTFLVGLFVKNSLTLTRSFIHHEFIANRYIHHYKNMIPWTNVVELSEELIKSVIYHDENLLVLNKPYGVSFSRDVSCKTNNKTNIDHEDAVFQKGVKHKTKNALRRVYHTSGLVSDSLNLVDCLPYLKSHFGLKKLHIARVPEKYMSGVAILTTSAEYVEFINKCRLHSPTGKDKYLAIVVGTPRFLESNIKLGFKLEENKNIGKRPILLQKWTNRAYKRGEIRVGTFQHQTISSGTEKLTSLVEICIDLRKYHAYRIFCSDYLLSPVLGDNLLGSRVQTVMGVPVVVDPFSDVANSPQVLPKQIYRLLDLTSGESALIPIHIHHAEMLLPRFFRDKTPLLLKAPPPPHFDWTCEKLGLVTSAQTRQIASGSL